jgi:hypothetical protein
MQQSNSCETISCKTTPEIPLSLWNPKVNYLFISYLQVDVPKESRFHTRVIHILLTVINLFFLGLPPFISFPVSWFQILSLIPLFICHSNITSICLHLCKTLLIVPGVKIGTQHNLHFLTFLISKFS